ncbi:MAG: hypothetical protein R2818_02335 [Flavobacteriales bacterium]
MKFLQDLRFLLSTKTLAPLRSVLVLGVLLCSGIATGQVDNVLIYGTVKDLTSSKKLDDVTVTVFKNGAKLIDVPTNASGKYEINLDYGADYKIVVAKAGFVGKNIKIDTRNIPEEDRQGGHGMNIDFSMLTDLPGIDYSILNEPFGMAAYKDGAFTWDIDYTNRMRDAQARLMKEYDDMRKREGDLEAQFKKHMENGEKSFAAADFGKAVDAFTDALKIKPNDAIAKAKLSDARMRFEGLEAERKAAEKYAALIKEADGLYGKKDYAGAKVKYSAAIDVNNKEAYPKQKIKEIEAILLDLERQAETDKLAKELQEKYQAAIVLADAALKSENWDQAVAKYTEASGLKPDEKYPKDQLAVVATKRAEAEKKAADERLAKELEENYKGAITEADAAFRSSNWDVATAKYTYASELKPKEKYPTDQLAAILVKKEEQSKKAEEERLAKELQEQYQAAITAADAAFRAVDLDLAETKYSEASGLKPAEKYPKDQLAAIAKKREDMAKKAEEERIAQELDARYQGLITAADEAFRALEWETAIGKYTEASGLKPKEKYPTDQLAAIAKNKEAAARQAEEERKQRELNERYEAAIAVADQAFQKEKWDDARAKYSEASGVKPGESYPKDQIAAIAARIAEEEARKKQEALDASYQKAIDQADAAFGKKDYQTAVTAYREASAVKPAERYPKDRISEAEALIAEAARLAEEERKAAELEKRYSDLIKSADKFYDGKKLSEALNDYKDALTLKPEEAHPKARISTIEAQLDAAAQAKAEEERLLREKQERDKRYADLVTSADKAFAAKDYEKARADYASASGVKPDEVHPKDRLGEIERLLAVANSAAEEARLAAEREAAEKARLAEEARIAAEKAAAEKARVEEEERRKRMAAAEIDAEYREFVAAGDLAFSANDFDKARDKYTAALGVKPEEQYPKDRMAAMDAAIAKRAQQQSEAERLAEEQRRMDAERKAREAEEAEAARLAAASQRERDEAERLRKEREAEEALRAAEERERQEREGAKAIEERYRSTILRADGALAEKNYSEARGIYAEASDIKPDETYPLAKIDQIDKLLAEQERLRLEAELAAQKEAPVVAERPKSTFVSDGQEDEAVRFMREAREREEAEKYERIKKFRAEQERVEAENADAAADRRISGVEYKERVQEQSAQLYSGNDQRRMQRAEELAAFREALERSEAERRQRASEARAQNYQGKLAVVEQTEERDRAWSGKQEDRVTASLEVKELEERLKQERVNSGAQRTEVARQQVVELQTDMDRLAERGNSVVESQRRSVEAQKRAREVQETGYAERSGDARTIAKDKLDATKPDQPRAFADYNRSKLAQEYPEGVTEESYTEGNKAIIRRVVVRGNKADEYSKAIAKWGTFYFKNGQSITDAIWNNETGG